MWCSANGLESNFITPKRGQAVRSDWRCWRPVDSENSTSFVELLTANAWRVPATVGASTSKVCQDSCHTTEIHLLQLWQGINHKIPERTKTEAARNAGPPRTFCALPYN